MFDAVDQMRPTAHEEFQTSEREMGTEKQYRKNRQVCVFCENTFNKAPCINIFFIINNGSNDKCYVKGLLVMINYPPTL